ncbi:MAG: hypothetical protein K6B45_02495 [Bacteroidaceae bacterium]|nr:hypothetical protein [Bacteroidaceae bacterium]
MKKIYSLLFCTVLLCICCNTHVNGVVTKSFEETIINYDSASDEYRHYGYYKRVDRKYNYEYYDSIWCGEDRYGSVGIGYIINEYGDTICYLYTDYTNYPRRKEE